MTLTADDGVLVAAQDTDPAVVTITLNRPERKNAVSWPMWQRLLATFRELALDPGVRIVVLTGAGGDFCSGADLASPAPAVHPLIHAVHPLIHMDEINNVVLALHRLPKITIARVDGAAVGAGLNLALACDLVVASDRSRFAEIFVRRGTRRWPRWTTSAPPTPPRRETPSGNGAPPRSPGPGPAGEHPPHPSTIGPGAVHPRVTGAGPARRASHWSRSCRFKILPVAFCGRAWYWICHWVGTSK
jgi:hypothetical protein